MELTDVRPSFVRLSWTTIGVSVLGGLLVAPVLIEVTRTGLNTTGWIPGSPAGGVFLLLLAAVPASLIAALDGSLVASWVVSLPYSLFVLQELSCYGGGDCGPPPTLLDVLPYAVAAAAVAGTVGYSIATVTARRNDRRST